MKKFYFLFLFALIASIGNLYAAEVVLWEEDFSSGKLTGYVVGNGGGTTKIMSEKLAKGTAPELLIAKKGGYLQVTVSDLKGLSGKMTLTFKSNKTDAKFANVTTSTTGVTVSKPTNSSGVWTADFTVSEGVTSLTFKVENSDNAKQAQNGRYDDFKLVGYEAETKCAKPTFNLTADATYTDVQDLVITSTTEGAQIEYKIEGDKLTAPITGKQASPATVHLTANDTYMVTATATKEGLGASGQAELMFTIAKKCAAPTFSLVSGSYTTAQTVTITGPEGSTITYTLNEAIFEAPSPVNVELPLVEGVSTTYNLSALASMKDFKDSEETKAVYVINESYADKTATLNIADYASANGWTNGEQYPSAEIDDVKFTVKGGGIDGKYYKSNYSWRVYASTPGTLTISVPAMHIISSVVYKAANAFVKADSGTLSKGTKTDEWKWNAAATNTTEGDPVNSVIFTAGDNKNVELKEVTVYYAYDPVSSVSSMSVEGVKVFAAEGGVEVVAEEAAEVAVYTAAGQLVRQARVAEGSTLVNVAPGFYVVRANGTATKVIVR